MIPIRWLGPAPGVLAALFCGWLLFAISTHAAPKPTDSATPEQLEQLKQQISQLDQWLKKANAEKSGLSARLRKEEKTIDQVSGNIRDNQERIGILLKQLTQLEQDYKARQAELREQKDFYARQIRASYLQGKQPALKLLLNSDSPQEAMRQMRYLSYLNQARGDKIQGYQTLLAQLKATENSLLERKTELAKEREALATSQKQLNASMAQRKQVLAQLNASIKSEGARLKSLKADQVRLEALLKEIEEALAKMKLPHEGRPFSEHRAKLPWPSRGRVLARFGSQTIQGKLRSNGIRIAVGENTPIRSVYYGQVVFSDWLRGFGLLMIIDHGDGFMSLYGNNRSLIKNTGDRVKAGEVIAHAGAGTTEGESGLYFEIRHNGKPLNPIPWLEP